MSKTPTLSGGNKESIGDHVKLGVVTVSDRASAGIYDDLSGPAILHFFEEAIESRSAASFRGECATSHSRASTDSSRFL